MRELLAAAAEFTLVGEAASGEEALGAVDELSPKLVIMDKRMSGMGGIEATRRLTARYPELIVVLASVEEPDERVIEECGAAAFVRKHDFNIGLVRDLWRQHGT